MGKRLVVALVLSVVFLTACSLPVEGQQKGSPQDARAGVGRYQIIMWPGQMPGLHTYLLDTATGRVWLVMTDPETDRPFWAPLAVIGGDTPWNAEARTWMLTDKATQREAIKKKKSEQ